MNFHVTTRPRPDAKMVDVLAEIRARRHDFERLTYVPPDMIEKLKQVGIYRAFVPRALGGDEIDPASFCRMIEQIAIADPSTGWVASFGVSALYLAALPPATFTEIYGNDPDTVFAGAIFPPQPALKVDGGYEVQGRWPYCSGCMSASLIGAGIRIEGGSSPLPRMAVLPRDKVAIKHTWDTVGLTATGSHDIVVDGVVVPEEWTFIRGAKANRDEPVYRYPAMALAAQVLAVVGLGAAQDSLDWVYREALEKPSVTGAPSIGARPNVQYELGQAEARLRGARSFFYEAIEAAWSAILAGQELSREEHVRLRLAATEAAHAGADVARQIFQIAGTDAIKRGHPVLRNLLDASAVSQHAFLSKSTWGAAGASLLGQSSLPGYP